LLHVGARTDRQTEMTKLIFAFRSYAKCMPEYKNGVVTGLNKLRKKKQTSITS
jgi:hypothetical protein